jgi:hypothetical protein
MALSLMMACKRPNLFNARSKNAGLPLDFNYVHWILHSACFALAHAER